MERRAGQKDVVWTSLHLEVNISEVPVLPKPFMFLLVVSKYETTLGVGCVSGESTSWLSC